MRVSVESTGTLGRRLQVSVPAEEVEAEFKERLKAFSRTARLKGFRPGKAPLSVIQKRFGNQLREEVVGELIRSSLAQALNEAKLAPAGTGPRIESLSADSGQDLMYAATFEVYPEIEIRGLDSLNIVKPVAEPSVADVEAMIDTLRLQKAVYLPVSRAARDTDQLTIDFEGRIDGNTFTGGTARGVRVIQGEGRMLKAFEAGIAESTAGERRRFPVTFPADYGEEALAGRTAEFEVTVSEVAERGLPPLDEAFCREFGVTEGGVEQLKREVEDNMRRELDATIRGRLRQQVLDQVLAANPLDLPSGDVERQVQVLQAEWLKRVGAAARDLKERPPREPFEPTARRRVALGLLIGELVRREQIRVDVAQVEQRVESAASAYPDPGEAARQIRDRPELMAQLEAATLEDQVVDWLVARAKVAEQPASYRDVMNFGA
jgi:trigger factor